MTQIFIFGASVAYGAKAEKAGWADLLKQSLQAKMYSEHSFGEQYELYNFAQPGAKAEFVLVTHADQLKFYRRSGKIIAIVCVGGNNIKAENKPNIFTSSVKEYGQVMAQLLKKLSDTVDELIVLPSLVAVDESKTKPESDPRTGVRSYFSNDRIVLFNQELKKLSDEVGARYVAIDVSPKEWAEKYLYADGLHPNQAGHQYIFETVIKVVDELLSS